VQIKTGRAPAGAVRFCTCGRNPCRTRKGNAYHGDADCFAVWLPELARLFLVPVAECGSRKGVLRLAPTRNGQIAGVGWAADYEVHWR
jgi:hypothetical protein